MKVFDPALPVRRSMARHSLVFAAQAPGDRGRVSLDRPNLQILVEYLKGPFSHLENRWTFKPAVKAGKPVSIDVLVGIPSDPPKGGTPN